MPRTLGSKNVAIPKPKYEVTMFNIEGNPTFTKQFPTIDSIVEQIKMSNTTIRRILRGTSTQNFIKVVKLSKQSI